MKKTVLVSDLTGEEIIDLVQIKFTYGNSTYLVDAERNDPIVDQLVTVARKQGKRGRPKKNGA